MIHFKIQGRIKNKILVEQYIASILRELNIHRLRRPCIVIEFTSTLANHNLGSCVGDSDFAFVSVARFSENNPIAFSEQLQALAHELVHAKQYIRGELSYNTEGDWRWKNRNAGGYRYHNQPWEREANRLEKILFSKCLPTGLLRGTQLCLD